jgi:hypothetical protein
MIDDMMNDDRHQGSTTLNELNVTLREHHPFYSQ